MLGKKPKACQVKWGESDVKLSVKGMYTVLRVGEFPISFKRTHPYQSSFTVLIGIKVKSLNLLTTLCGIKRQACCIASAPWRPMMVHVPLSAFMCTWTGVDSGCLRARAWKKGHPAVCDGALHRRKSYLKWLEGTSPRFVCWHGTIEGTSSCHGAARVGSCHPCSFERPLNS